MLRRLILASCVLALLAVAPAAQAQTAQRCFRETGFCIAGRFRQFWEQHGGLAVFGYPIAAQRAEPVEGRSYQVQWFERSRFELHPENQPPYDVLLGRLGADRLAAAGRDWWTFPKASPTAPHYFAATGHAVPAPFWEYWSSHGLEFDGRPGKSLAESLALFGLPLSEATVEASPTNGQLYLTQHFERARFEFHPENAPPYNVLLGLLGSETLAALGPRQVGDLAALRGVAAGRRLAEHITDSVAIHLANYPDALSVTAQGTVENYPVDLALGPRGSATLRFAGDIYAIGFSYQQGLANADFRVTLTDGSTFDYSGRSFLPDSAFFGFVAPQPIAALRVRTEGSFYLRAFYFYATRQYQPKF